MVVLELNMRIDARVYWTTLTGTYYVRNSRLVWFRYAQPKDFVNIKVTINSHDRLIANVIGNNIKVIKFKVITVLNNIAWLLTLTSLR